MHEVRSRVILWIGLTLTALAAAACGVNTHSSGAVHVLTVSPDAGSMTGGSAVTITGNGFSDGTGNVKVTFGATQVEGQATDDTTVHVTLPAGLACGPVDVKVQNGNGSGTKSDAFSYSGGSGTLTLVSVSPDNGALAGGTAITITGSGFTGGVGVTLGGVPLEGITVVSDTQITATVPAATNGGGLDLVARNCATQAKITQAFVYTTGLNGGIVEIPLVEVGNSAQFPGQNTNPYIDPYVAFLDPTADPILVALPATDTCMPYAAPASASFTYLDGGSNVDMTSGAKTISLALQTTNLGGTVYFEYYYPLSDNTAYDTTLYVNGGSYDFTSQGSATLPAFTVPGALAVPSKFATAQSPQGSGINLYAAPTPATFTKTNAMTVTWAGPFSTDPMEIFIEGYDNTAAPAGTPVICAVADDGSFQIPANTFKLTDNTPTQALVFFYRRKVGSFLNRANGSTMTTLSYDRKLAYVFLQ
jgi:hypothetical protein